MKKALFLTMLLAGTALADTPNIGASADPTRVNYTSQIAFGNDGVVTATSNHGGTALAMTPPTYEFTDGNSNAISYIGGTNAINSNIGSGGSFIATYHFPVSGATSDNYTISNVSLSFGVNNEAGTTYPLASYMYANDYKIPEITVTVSIIDSNANDLWTGSKVVEFDNYDTTITSDGFSVNPEVSLSGDYDLVVRVDYKESTSLLSAEEQETVNSLVTTADWDESEYMGNLTLFYSIDHIDVSGNAPASLIPEPSTATLSLLALAGLAARRRRK